MGGGGGGYKREFTIMRQNANNDVSKDRPCDECRKSKTKVITQVNHRGYR